MSNKSRKCLVCCKKGSDSNSDNTVENQVRAIFVLRKLFNISTFDCSEILRNEATNPSSWLCFCQKCFAAIVEAEKIFRQLTKLELKWSGLKKSFMTKFEHGKATKVSGKEEQLSNKIRDLAVKGTKFDECTVQEESVQDILTDKDIKLEIKYENCSDAELDAFIGDMDTEGLNLDIPEEIEHGLHKEDANSKVTTTPAKEVRRSRSGRIINPVKIESRPHYTYENSDSSESEERSRSSSKSSIADENYVKQHKISKKIAQMKVECEDSSNLEDPKVKCSYCNNVYSNENGKNEHENRTHGTNHFFRCNYCSKSYCTLFVLYRHYKDVHRTEPDTNHRRVFEDPIRRKKMRTKKGYPKRSLECKRCNKTLGSFEALQYHERHCGKNHNKIFCSYCNTGFNTEHKLRLHIYKTHDQSQMPYTCNQCDKKYTNLNNLKKHEMNIHLKQKNFICEICSEGFTELKLLQYHQKRKHGDPDQLNELRCQECSKIMCNASALRNHILAVHKRQFKVKCPICNVGRMSQSALDSHVLVAHTNYERPYVCTVCKKSYISKSILDGHMRIHTEERPHQCKSCEKAFYTSKKLKRHEVQVHAPDGVSFECPTCHKKFRSQYSKVNHIYITHNKKISTLPPKQIVDHELLKGLVTPIPKTKPANRRNQFRLKIEEKFKNSPQDIPTNENANANPDAANV